MKLFIVPSWYPTNLHQDTGTFFYDRAKILNNNGFDVTTIAYVQLSAKDVFKINKIEPNSVIQNDSGLVYKKIKLNPFPKLPRLSFLYYRKHLIKLFQTALNDVGKPDFVLINSSLWAGAALGKFLRKNSIKYVVSEHLKEFLINRGFSNFEKRSVKNSYQYATKIIATSNALKKGILRIGDVPPSKICIISNPADISLFSIRKKTPVNQFEFVGVALFRREKRIDILIKAFASLYKTNKNIHLTLVGNGPERYKLEKLIVELKIPHAVTMCGFLGKENVSKILNQSNTLVLNSDVETFGVVLVEALASGLPVIATRCGGPEDIVNSQTGYLVEKANEEELISAMNRIISNYNDFDPKRLREIAENKYGDKAYVKQISNLLNS